MSEPVLEMKDVVKYYGDNVVLNGVSFRVLRGETKIMNALSFDIEEYFHVTGFAGAVKGL